MSVAVDLFAGPGGWDVAAAAADIMTVGLDVSADATATARAAGHVRGCADVTKVDPLELRGVDGLIGSPPCQGFSTAGKRRGHGDAALLLAGISTVRSGEHVDELIGRLHVDMADDRSVLTLEPLRWALYLRPTWITLEQVPAVLPIWQAYAAVLHRAGYGVATGVLHAEQHGVPQTRNRAVLIARLDEPVSLPTPTHSRYYPRTPDRLDPGVPQWVSMADALGGAYGGHLVRSNYGTGGDPRLRGIRTADQPAAAVAGAGLTSLDTAGQRQRPTDEPVATITGKGTAAWVPVFADQSGTPADATWPYRRPSTTVAGRGLVQNPGATANRFNGSTKSRNDGVRVTVQEAAILQTFPADYPWCGTSTSRYQQVGDAIPPLLAGAVLRAATS